MTLGVPETPTSPRQVPNVHGIFPPDQWTENIVHRTKHGYVEIHLVDCGDGWTWGCDYGGVWMGGGRWPHAEEPRLPDRQAALDAALDRLRHAVDPASHWEPGDRLAGAELIAWVNTKQQQRELFS